MKPAPGMNMAISFGIAFLTTVSTTKSMMPLMTCPCRSISFSLISSQAAAGPRSPGSTTMSKPVSSPCDAVSPTTFTILPRISAR